MGVTDTLGHRYLPAVAVLLGTALVLPALRAGLVADDHLHRLRMEQGGGFPGLERAPLDQFVFASGSARQRQVLMDEGVFAWWPRCWPRA